MYKTKLYLSTNMDKPVEVETQNRTYVSETSGFIILNERWKGEVLRAAKQDVYLLSLNEEGEEE